MQITYQLSESEFTYDFFRALKKTLKGKKKVEISVSTETTSYKMKKEDFENMVLENENPDYIFKGDEFQEFTQRVLNGENINLENYKK